MQFLLTGESKNSWFFHKARGLGTKGANYAKEETGLLRGSKASLKQLKQDLSDQTRR